MLNYHEILDERSPRVEITRHEIRNYLKSATGPRTILSICSGAGNDILRVLAQDEHEADVYLLDVDVPALASARDYAREHGVPNVNVLVADASDPRSYAQIPKADLVIIGAVFGHMITEDKEKLISFLPQVCLPGAVVIWNERAAGDLYELTNGFFHKHGFVELSRSGLRTAFRVFVTSFTGAPELLRAGGEKLFTFYDTVPPGYQAGISPQS